MSAYVTSLVWDGAVRATGSDLVLLLALADFASDDGECRHSVASLAVKTRGSERTVQRGLASLTALGYLDQQKGGHGPHSVNLYRVKTVTLRATYGLHKGDSYDEPEAAKGDTSDALEPAKGDNPGSLEASKGDNPDRLAPEPQAQPSTEEEKLEIMRAYTRSLVANVTTHLESKNKRPTNAREIKPVQTYAPESYVVDDALWEWAVARQKWRTSRDALQECADTCFAFHRGKGNKNLNWRDVLENWIRRARSEDDDLKIERRLFGTAPPAAGGETYAGRGPGTNTRGNGSGAGPGHEAHSGNRADAVQSTFTSMAARHRARIEAERAGDDDR
jgi:hypothetical protein